MVLWRISSHPELTGIGAELSQGRWHTKAPGKRVVYLAAHPALALLENLANLRGDPSLFPNTFQLLRIVANQSLVPQELTPEQLADVYAARVATTQAIGDAWLAAATSALLRVPSIPSPESGNYLLNPLHPQASALKLDWARHFDYDRRLFHLTHA